jgi:hypothetical protein
MIITYNELEIRFIAESESEIEFIKSMTLEEQMTALRLMQKNASTYLVF